MGMMSRVGLLLGLAVSAAVRLEPRTTTTRRDALAVGAATFLATGSAAFAEEALSPAQAKLAAAKAASEAKLAARGLKSAETKSLSVEIPMGGGKDKDDLFG